MTDILLGPNNDILIVNGQLQLIDSEEVLVRQRLLNRLRSFTGTLFTNTDYGIDSTLLFEKNTQTLLDQHLKTIISNVSGIEELVSFSSEVSASRVYSATLQYRISTGEIIGIKGLNLSANFVETVETLKPLWVNGYWDYSGTWDNDLRFGTDGIPTEADSDGDGYRDIDEISSGSDPEDYESFPDIVLKNGSGGYGDLSFWESAQDIFFRDQITGLPPMTFGFRVENNSFISGDSAQVYDGMVQKLVRNTNGLFGFNAKVQSSSPGQTVRFSFLEVDKSGVLQSTPTEPSTSLTVTTSNISKNAVSKFIFPVTSNTDMYLMVFTDVDAGETITISEMILDS